MSKVENILKLSSFFVNANNDTVQIITSRIIQQSHKILTTAQWLKDISDNNIFQSIITILSQVATTRNEIILNYKKRIFVCKTLIIIILLYVVLFSTLFLNHNFLEHFKNFFERNNSQLGSALCSLLISVSDNPAIMNHFIRLSLLSPLILASENLYLPLTESSDNEWPKLYTELTLLQEYG